MVAFGVVSHANANAFSSIPAGRHDVLEKDGASDESDISFTSSLRWAAARPTSSLRGHTGPLSLSHAEAALSKMERDFLRQYCDIYHPNADNFVFGLNQNPRKTPMVSSDTVEPLRWNEAHLQEA